MKLNMKSNQLILIAALSASTLGITLAGQNAFAEKSTGGTHEGRRNGMRNGGMRGGGRMMEKMSQELNLTASQKTKLQAIMKESRERGRKIRENKSLTEDQKRSKMFENRAATKKRMDAVLTSAQKKKLAEMRKQMRQQRHRDGKGPHSGQRKPI